LTSSSTPSITRARQQVALGSIAGIGVNRPAAQAPLARRLSGAEVTGVSYRVQAASGVSTSSLAAGAARAALRASGATAEQVEMIIVGTTSPDVLWPSTACLVQTDLALPMVGAFDLYAAETSFLAALDIAVRYVAAGSRGVLLIGADSDNQLVDLPGQGATVRARAAAAALLLPARGDAGVLASVIGGAARPAGDSDGEDRLLLQGLTDAVSDCLDRAQLRLDEIDLVIAEQSAPEIMRAWSRRQSVSSSRVLLDSPRYGSLLAAAPLTILHDAAQSGRLEKGMTVLLLGCGSGPVWSAACLRWTDAGIAEC
jgi:3-oxoacyl-[acyl-carrier-protein] synthase-3